MNLGSRASLCRCAVAWLAVTAASAVLVVGLLAPALAPLKVRTVAEADFATVLVTLCAGVGLVVVGWLWLMSSLVIADARRGATSRRRGVPFVIHRATLLLCGAAVTGGLATGCSWPALATAGDGVASADARRPQVLTGLRLPERVAVEPLEVATATTPLSDSPASRPATVTVRPGDTLWRIAAEQLGSHPALDDIARAWPMIYELNREVIGPDPGLIEPGQRLVLPDDSLGGHR